MENGLNVDALIFTADFEGMATRKDRTLKLVFSTQELPSDEAAVLMRFVSEYVTIAIKKREEISKDEVLELPEPQWEDMTKSPAQRLRGVLWHLWKKEKSTPDFELFYRQKMERLIEQIKERLA